MHKKICALLAVVFMMIPFTVTSCSMDDTRKLAKKLDNYRVTGNGYDEVLEIAKKGNYDANCEKCFTGPDTLQISLFSYACMIDYDVAKAIYKNGADIEVCNPDFPETPLLAALDGNRNNPKIVYWLIDEGADINAVSYDKCSVFQYLRYWEDNEETQELIEYFEDNCDMEKLEKKTHGTQFGSWDEMWDDDGNFVFYHKK